jgi:hypothetical protein
MTVFLNGRVIRCAVVVWRFRGPVTTRSAHEVKSQDSALKIDDQTCQCEKLKDSDQELVTI